MTRALVCVSMQKTVNIFQDAIWFVYSKQTPYSIHKEAEGKVNLY